MATAASRPTPMHLWIVGILSLLWNAFGACDYTMTEMGNLAWFQMMGLGAEELAEPPLQLDVDLLRAADEAHRGHPVAPAVERLVGGGDHRRVVGEAEVVVGAEVDQLRAGEADVAALGRGDRPLRLAQPGGVDLRQLRRDLRADLAEHRVSSSR